MFSDEEVNDRTCKYCGFMDCVNEICRWIQVKDQLPEEGQAVWYFFEHTGVDHGEYKLSSNELADGVIWEMDCFFGKRGFLCDDVTHWMPYVEGSDKPQEPFGWGNK